MEVMFLNNMGKRGLFIVFEGIDGCGKGTQVKLFHGYLFDASKYHHILCTREPFMSREIRTIMQQDSDAYAQPEKCAELFIGDRQRHVDELIIPHLNRGEGFIVVCDRYKYSTIAYQSTQGLDVHGLIAKHRDMPVPDLTFIVDVPVEVAVERMKKDAEREGEREHKFESDTEFMEKLRRNYLGLKELLPNERIVIIDGNKVPFEVHREIVRAYEGWSNNLHS
jgi:dTMP kinase